MFHDIKRLKVVSAIVGDVTSVCVRSEIPNKPSSLAPPLHFANSTMLWLHTKSLQSDIR